MGCTCPFRVAESLPAHPLRDTQRSKVMSPLAFDRAALKTLLSSRAEVLEAMAKGKAGPKATGRPSANVNALWKFYTTSVYTSGDLPAIATREALQNSVDAIRAAIKARKLPKGEGRFEVDWDPDTRTITFTDNGIGMSAQDILEKFISLGTSGKGGAADSDVAAGGFGVAKAVILGTSETFKWELLTRDNRAVVDGFDDEVSIYNLAPPIEGTILRVFDVPNRLARPRYSYQTKRNETLEERLKIVLGGCDLDDIELRLNGETIKRHFSRKRGSRLAQDAPWGDGTTARIRGHKRPHGDKSGGYWVRLNGLYQFHRGSDRGNLGADIVIDLTTTIRPGQPGYPLNTARDGFAGEANAFYYDLKLEVEKENLSASKDAEYQVFDPEGQAGDEGDSELLDLTAEAFDDPELQRALKAASGGKTDLLKAMTPLKRQEPASNAPASKQSVDDEDDDGGPAPGTPDVIRRFLKKADDFHAKEFADGKTEFDYSEIAPLLDPWLEKELAAAERSGKLSLKATRHANHKVAAASKALASKGLSHVADAPRVKSAVLALSGGKHLAPTSKPKPKRKPRNHNPFGSLAGLRISSRYYDKKKASRFKSNWKKSLPALVLWDSTLRLVASEGGVTRGFKPGWVLDDEVVGLTAAAKGKTPVVYLHPDRLKEVAKAHKTRPMGVAGFLHGLACHELAHLDGRMGQGHDQEFVSAREGLGDKTAHLLPAIALLATNLLKLKPPPSHEAETIAKLESQLARLKASRGKASQKAKEAIALAEASLAECNKELEAAKAISVDTAEEMESGPGKPAPVVDASYRPEDSSGTQLRQYLENKDPHGFLMLMGVALRVDPPPGMTKEDVDLFFNRYEAPLLQTVKAALHIKEQTYPTPRNYPGFFDTPNRKAIYRVMLQNRELATEVVSIVERITNGREWRLDYSRKQSLQAELYHLLGSSEDAYEVYDFIRDRTTY